jgi:HlyD family secretion protein
MRRKRLMAAGLGAVAVFAAVAVWRNGRAESVEADVAAVRRTATLRSFVTASGEIVAGRFANIGSDTMGRLVSLSVKEGDRVTAGQIVAQIDAVQAASAAEAATASLDALRADAAAAGRQVEAGEADLAAARARQDEADKALARATDLRAAGLLPAADFDAATATAAAAAAQVRAAQAAVLRIQQTREAAARRVAQGRADVARVRDQVRKTSITAPIDGTVTRLNVEEGEMVVIGVQNQPGTILMTISDLSAVDAEVKVAEADVLRVSLGQQAVVSLEALPGEPLNGRVAEIGASALPQTGVQAAAREFLVRVRLDDAPRALRPGLTCDTEILVAERQQVLTVPLQAVVERPGPDGVARPGVFVVDATAARFTPVTPGIIGGLDIEVEGVAEGATVVIGPFQLLRGLADGARIRPRPADAKSTGSE